MTRNLIESEWVSRWGARKVLRRAQYHLVEWGDDSSACLLDPLIRQLTPTTAGEQWPDTASQYSLYLLWRVHRRLLAQGDTDAALVVLEVVLSFFR